MRALFCHDHFYKRGDNGQTVLSEGQFHAALWRRYLKHFNSLTVLGRDGGMIMPHRDINNSDAPNVKFELFPDTNHLKGLLSGRHDIKKQIRKQVQAHDCVILRGISEIGILAYFEAKRQNKVIALENIACSWDSLWYHGTLQARLYAPYRFYMARKITKNADAVIYVADNFLPKRYPSTAEIQAVASNVQINGNSENILADRLNKIANYNVDTVYKIGLIGALSNALKGIETAVLACAELKKSGFDRFELHILGPGDAAIYHTLIRKNHLGNHVFFDGIRQSGAPVMAWLREMDIYIQPSLQEGLPRAVIEAMSEALPVIGSNAGGIPELLCADYIIGKKKPRQLAEKITDLIHSPALMIAQSKYNFEQAKKYDAAVLEPKRDDFWQNVLNKTMALRCRPK